MTPTVPTAALAPQPRPAPRPARRPGEHLRPVRRPTTRRSPAVPVLVGAGIVLAALFALAVMHALLIGGQLRLDDLQREVAAETEQIHRLRLRVAELESPDRVLDVARQRLGMVLPTEVGYLPPVEVDAGDVDAVRVEPAVVDQPESVIGAPTSRRDDRVPPADDTETPATEEDGTASTDESAVEDAVVGSSVDEDATATDGSTADGGDE